jgi:hypothetical protein
LAPTSHVYVPSILPIGNLLAAVFF